MQPYALAKALVDSGKMLALDQMLITLKGEGHKVLLFCQVGAFLAKHFLNNMTTGRC